MLENSNSLKQSAAYVRKKSKKTEHKPKKSKDLVEFSQSTLE